MKTNYRNHKYYLYYFGLTTLVLATTLPLISCNTNVTPETPTKKLVKINNFKWPIQSEMIFQGENGKGIINVRSFKEIPQNVYIKWALKDTITFYKIDEPRLSNNQLIFFRLFADDGYQIDPPFSDSNNLEVVGLK